MKHNLYSRKFYKLTILFLFMFLMASAIGSNMTGVAYAQEGGNEPPTPDAPADAISQETESAAAGAGSEGSPQKRETPSGAPQYQVTQLPTDRIIIKFKGNSSFFSTDIRVQEQKMESLSSLAGEPMRYLRAAADGAHVLQFSERLSMERVWEISNTLMASPDVEYAEPDQIMQHTLTPNDTRYGEQWHYFGSYGANLPAAWDITTGSSSVVVAVIDTGITTHSDLSGKILPGYDFIIDSLVANDGNGRDSNPSDPGDWITSGESSSGWFYGCSPTNSSWHGTHVAGTIGANTNNSAGVAGVSWGAKILPVRVLGKCGGYLSDIADGIRWAAGASVTGVPANANPAKVLNMSLGGYGACSATYQSAINAAKSKGASVVVSAGNSNYYASQFQPANCSGVITVGATDIDGYLASYSNYDSSLEISAPGGDFIWDSGVLSTLNSGTTSPSTESYANYQGTSMAAPHVSGVIALMLSVNPSLTPTQVLQILQSSARDFGSSWCNTTTNCGAGLVDAAAAVRAAQFYGWSGGVSIGSTQNIVAIGRPHVGSEVASYNGFATGSLTSYIPMLFKNAYGGSYDSAFYVQNLNTINTANITIKYYDGAGTLNCTVNDTVSPLASKGYWLPSETCLADGWVGGVVVTSDRNIVAVGRPHIGAEVMTYDGFSAGSSNAWIPMLFKDAYGGSYDAAFYVQNVSSSNTANISIKYYDSAGTLSCTVNDTISALASKGYWLPSETCLPVGWVGGVAITSDQAIVTVGRPHIGAQITTYNGFMTGGTTSYVPMLFKNAYGGSYDAAYYVQNLSSTTTANITIKYYDSTGILSCTVNDTVAPLASKGYWTPSETCLADGWVGGAVITSSQSIVAVGRPHIGSQITTYTSFSAGNGGMYLPMMFNDSFGGSYDSALYVQNTSTTTAASVVFSFYDANGSLKCTKTDNIPALSTLGYWLPSVVCDP